MDIKKIYGITLKQYNKILANQNYKCAICKKPASSFSKALSVDHRHNSDPIFIRGLLCYFCNNKVLGRIRDKKILWEGLGEYIKNALKKDKEWE